MTRFTFQGTGQTTGGDGLAWGAVLALILICGGGALFAAAAEFLIVAAVVVGVLAVAAAVLLAWWLRKGLPARQERAAQAYLARVEALEEGKYRAALERHRRALELAAVQGQAQGHAIAAAMTAASRPPAWPQPGSQPWPQPARVVRAEVEK